MSSEPKPTGRRSEFRADRRSEQGHRGTASNWLASIAHRPVQCARFQTKLLAGDCGVWCQVAPFDLWFAPLADAQSWPVDGDSAARRGTPFFRRLPASRNLGPGNRVHSPGSSELRFAAKML